MADTTHEAITPAGTKSHLEAISAALRSFPGIDLSILEDFLDAFHFRTPAVYFDGRDPTALALEIVEAHDFMSDRPAASLRVRVLAPAAGEPSILQVTMDDQPFILDSVLETLRVLDVPVQHYLHPILQIDRDGDRQIVAAQTRTAPGTHESFLHFRLANLQDDDAREQLEREIRDALTDTHNAVRDFAAMRERVDTIARELANSPAASPGEKRDMSESADLLRWLSEDNFLLLGCRSYRVEVENGSELLQTEENSGLGIFGDERGSAVVSATAVCEVGEDVRKRLRTRVFPLIGKTNRFSRVHRRAPMDSVGIKRIDAAGKVVGEHRILGLFTAKALNQICSDIPVLRRKLAAVLQRAQVLEGSHDYKQIITTFNSTPKAELFATSVEQISSNVEELLALGTDNGVHVLCQPDILGQRHSVMVILPRERFNTTVRKRIQAALNSHFGVSAVEYRLVLSEESGVRLHFYYQHDTGKLHVPTRLALQNAVVQAVRTWDDDFTEFLVARFGGEHGAELARRHGGALPESYHASVSPAMAVADVDNLERLGATADVEISIEDAEDDSEVSSLRLYRSGAGFRLSDIMPVLDALGLLVLDESTFAIGNDSVPLCHLHAIGILKRNGDPVPRERRADLREAILALIQGTYENDALGELVVTAELTIRQVALLRAYVDYSHQIRWPHDRESVALTLSNHPGVTALLLRHFEARFKPGLLSENDLQDRLGAELVKLDEELDEALEAVTDINEDRIVRGLWSLIRATTRTSYFQKGGSLPRMSFKIRSADVPGMPRPVPDFEIFVHGAAMEGVHLRSGAVARGGIRWSDRRDDYRTEVLGLMRTQVTKNAIIVPVGSKGGFVLKRPPASRQDLTAEVERQYGTYIRGLLDLTDNRVGDAVLHPADTVIHDRPDPYLVVAADKGTATFSDLGNSIAREYGFWLDDAFAAGGSNGYDHKKFGITARGAWESVRWHFLEKGHDVDHDPFTVVGIGDMSGDVFGNGMLLSRKIRLVAAFDHRHIFIDPDPDPAISGAERERLFRLPGSSWADYRDDLISQGGGVFSRQLKQIELSAEIQALLETDASSMTSDDLIRAVTTLRVDLLYNGGIGTYVKASHEDHADASDEKNDALRVNAGELRCSIIAEGGNLGLTPAARVEYARCGGRINGDFIDNSGGVDLSDHEVNLKIALARSVREGRLTVEERNHLLEGVAPEVCEMVLATNRGQARILSLEETISRSDAWDYVGLLDDLRDAGILDPLAESLPDAVELARRQESGLGLSRPELATLLALGKIDISRALGSSELLDSPGFESYLPSYFPRAVRELCGDDLAAHPLRREIVATMCTNEIVDHCGITLVSRLRRDHGCDTAAAIAACRAADLLLGGAELFASVDDLVGRQALTLDTRSLLILEYRGALARVAGWLARLWPCGADDEKLLSVTAVVEMLSPWLEESSTWLELDALATLRDEIARRSQELVERGVPEHLAQTVAGHGFRSELPALLAVSHGNLELANHAGAVYFMLRDTLGMPAVLAALDRLPAAGPDDRGALRAVRHELLSLVLRLTATVVTRCPRPDATEKAVGQFVYNHWRLVEPYLTLAEELRAGSVTSLSTFVVLTGRLRRLADADWSDH